jgi:hypothetical protein
VYLLDSVGYNDESMAIYNLYKDGQLLMKNTPYREGIDKAIDEIKPNDTYQEKCNDDLYCNITAEKLWQSHVGIQLAFGHFTEESAKKWVEEKMAQAG